MKLPYRSTNPNTGVLNYEITGSTITLEFQHPKHRYVYGPITPGPRQVATMMRLARRGKGLSTYISQKVKSYQAKLPLAQPQLRPPDA